MTTLLAEREFHVGEMVDWKGIETSFLQKQEVSCMNYVFLAANHNIHEI